MKLRPIIDHLKAETTSFGGRIAGASEYASEVEAGRMTMPCAFVVRGTVSTDGESASVGAVVQVLAEEFGIAVAVDNTDKRGQDSEEVLDDIRRDLLQALLGWLPPGTEGHYNAFDYVGDTPIELNRARVWRLFVFRTSTAISSLDPL